MLFDSTGREIEPYVILSVCNLDLIHQAIGVEREIGVLLPSSVLIRGAEDWVYVAVQDPALIASVASSRELEHIAFSTRALLVQALKTLSAPAYTS
jgi:uncharacterized protein (DUF302 family)